MGGSTHNSAPNAADAAASPLDESGASLSTAMFVAPTVEELNELLPQFEVIELLGQGGMGAVYKARQPRLDRHVAIKLLPSFAGMEEHSFAERFEREARAMAKMNHPNIVTVHDFGETEDGHRFIVMEYVDGYDLHHAIQSGKLTVKHAMGWIPQICSALNYAHDQGLVHRDIKPANILISKEGEVKVGDFGLAKLVGLKHETSITRSQVSMGTPDYAAPEALEEGGIVDRRADIYSIGVLFYELLTGKVPRGAWKPPSSFVEVDVRLDRIIVKAMQPEPDHRYQTVAQLTESLEELRHSPKMVVSRSGSKQLLTGNVTLPSSQELEEMKLTGKPAAAGSPPKSRIGKRDRVHPLFVAGIALGGILVAVGAILMLVMPRDSGEKPAPPPPVIVEPEKPGGEEPKTPEIVSVPKAEPKPEVRPPVPQPAAVPAFALREPPRPEDGWIDLMDGLTTKNNAVRGNWVIRKSGEVALEGKISPEVYPRLPFPVGPRGSYEFEVLLTRSPAVDERSRPLGLILPIFSESVVLVLDAGKRQGGTAGLSDVDGFPAAHLRNPTRFPLQLESGRPYRLRVQVIAEGPKIGVFAALDSEQVLRWEGTREQISTPIEARSPNRRVIAVASRGPVTFAEPRLRALGRGVALEGEPAPVPEMKESQVAAERLAAVQKAAEARIAAEAEAPFQELVVNQLHKGYDAALRRLMDSADRSRDLLTKSAAQRELDRITNLRPIEADDPPEMPQEVKDARARYRVEIGKLEAQRDLLVLPVLRDQLAEIEALKPEFASLEDSAAALKQVEAAAQAIREKIAAFESKIPPPPKEPEPESAAMTPSEPVPAVSAVPPLQRPPFPPVRPDRRGAVVAWGRQPDAEKEGLGDVARGLLSSAVAIAGGDGVAAALKSNGRIVVWGNEDGTIPVILDPVPEPIDEMDNVVAVSVANSPRDFHLAALDEAGKIEIFTVGWSEVALDFRQQVEAIEGAVDVVASPKNGIALLQDGNLVVWGRFPPGAVDRLPDRAVKIVSGPQIQAVIREDHTVLAFGPSASALPPNLTEVRDLVFGTQGELGGLAILRNGAPLTVGTFAQWQNDLAQLSAIQPIVRIIGGYEALAVQTSDREWYFFGTDMDAEFCQQQARGCSDLLIGRKYVVGLKNE